MKRILLIYIVLFPLLTGIISPQNGETRVAKWKDDKEAAFCLGFDDSLPTQLENAIPNLEARGLTGTFYVNPGKSLHLEHNEEWLNILNRGFHLAPHTMNHIGATSFEMAYYEIGASAEYCWDAYGVPYHSELLAYASGGGVTWSGLTIEERYAIDDHFNLINRDHNNPTLPHWHSDRMPYSSTSGRRPLAELIDHFNDNLANKGWEKISYHGVGGNSSVDSLQFCLLLDYIESKKDVVWISHYIAIFKYDMERFSAEVEILQNTKDIIKLRLSSDISASGFITNDVNLYNEPLTLITQVPWSEVTVTQGSSVNTYKASGGEVMYEALPNVGTTNRGDIILKQSVVVPVELKSFSASVKNSSVILKWETASEVNNYGFEIQRSIVDEEWKAIAFVEGFGTTTEVHIYSYVDDNIIAGQYRFRLKQIDFNGQSNYSDIVEVELLPMQYALFQNYPNPFNPTTTISYTVLVKSNVVLKVFDVLGNEIAALVNEEKQAGTYEITWYSENLPSGVYFYRLQAGDFIQTKRMVLLR